MSNPLQVFGYGSLVDQRTHDHPLTPAILTGWKRIWREVPGRDFAVLSVTRTSGVTLQGAIMSVARADLPALDAREVMYERQSVEIAGVADAVTYEVVEYLEKASKPILRSYLDVVLAGYTAMFGPDGVADFYATTSGWDVGVYDDRTAPIYPRHQPISTEMAAEWDALHIRVTT